VTNEPIDTDPAAGHFTYDVRERQWQLDPSVVDLHGLPHDGRQTTQDLLNRIHAHDRLEMIRRFDQQLRTAGTDAWTYRITGHEGRTRTLRFLSTGVTENGAVVRLEGSIVDLTDDCVLALEDVVAGQGEGRTGESARVGHAAVLGEPSDVQTPTAKPVA